MIDLGISSKNVDIKSSHNLSPYGMTFSPKNTILSNESITPYMVKRPKSSAGHRTRG